jgi:hypothetical protein
LRVTAIDFARAPLLIFAVADIDFSRVYCDDIAIDFSCELQRIRY